MRRKKIIFISSILAINLEIKATNNVHYFKAANLHRNMSTCQFDDLHSYKIENWVLKVTSNLMYGSTASSWDKNGHNTNILNDTGA